MEEIRYIAVSDICNGYRIERTYITTLQDYGLLSVEKRKDDDHISSLDLVKLEKILRFQNELNINLEGIHAIMNLLDRLNALQTEMKILQRQIEIKK